MSKQDRGSNTIYEKAACVRAPGEPFFISLEIDFASEITSVLFIAGSYILLLKTYIGVEKLPETLNDLSTLHRTQTQMKRNTTYGLTNPWECTAYGF